MINEVEVVFIDLIMIDKIKVENKRVILFSYVFLISVQLEYGCNK